MADRHMVVDESKLTNVANAIRSKTGKSDLMTLDEMVTEIEGVTGNIGWVSNDDTDSWKYLLENYYKPWTYANYATCGFSATESLTSSLFCYQNAPTIRIKAKTRKNFSVEMEIYGNGNIRRWAVISGGGYYNLGSYNDYSSVSYGEVTNEQTLIIGAVSPYPKVQAKIGKWSAYNDITWSDIIKIPPIFTVSGVTYKVQNCFAIANTNTNVRLYLLGDGSEIRFADDNKAFEVIVNGAVARYSYDIGDWNPSPSLNTTYTENVTIDHGSDMLESVQASTCDILNENGEVVYKADCTLEELILMLQTDSIVPIMWSNSQDGYIASASSSISDSRGPYRAFDGNLSEKLEWHSDDESFPKWLQIELPESKTVKRVIIKNRILSDNSYYNRGTNPNHVDIMASNDGTEFDTLASVECTNYLSGSTNEFSLDNATAYKFYRLKFTDNQHSSHTYVTVGELVLLEE